MNVRAIQTDLVNPGSNLFAILNAAMPTLPERCVVAVASKIVSICEGRVVPMAGHDKNQLVKKEASYYLPRETNRYGVTISVTRNHLVASGGVDESNGNGYYVLWPKDLQKSANMIRGHLSRRHKLKEVGVIITDSTTRPFQWGTTGLGIAYSGFEPLKNYIGTPDLFGRTLEYHQNNIMNGLAAAAVVVMGEGNEQTPLAVIQDIPFVRFQPRDPTQKELARLRIEPKDDLYALLLKNVPWQKGDKA